MTTRMERTEEGTPSSIREHAAEWFLRLHAFDLNVAERFAYLQWLKASPQHITETLQICRLYSVLYPMKKQLFFMNEDDISNVIALASREQLQQPTRTRSSWHVRVLAVAAAIGLVLVGGTMVTRTWFESTIETQASEWRSMTLNDGSFVSVGPRTELRDRFGTQQRLLSLSRGEALFQVAKDPSRPPKSPFDNSTGWVDLPPLTPAERAAGGGGPAQQDPATVLGPAPPPDPKASWVRCPKCQKLIPYAGAPHD